MIHRVKQFAKDGMIYGIGGIVARGLGFFLLPIFARIFKPADYGSMEMLNVLGLFASAVMGMGLDSAQSYYFFEQKKAGGEEAQTRMISAVLQWRLVAGGLIVAAATACAPALNRAFFDGQLSTVFFAVTFAGAWVTQMASQCTDIFRLSYKPWKYLSLTLLNTLSTAFLALFFITVGRMGILGNFVGSAIGSLLAMLAGWWGIRRFLDFSKLHNEWWPRLLRFGLPLVPSAIGMYVLQSGDRWFISYFIGRDALGLFAVGAKFAMVIAVAVTTFRQAWWPVALDAIQSDDGPEFLRLSARIYLGVAAAGIIFLTAISPWLVTLLTTRAYYGGYPVVGVLAWQSAFYGFFLICASGLWKAEKTAYVSIGMTIAALLNLVLDIAWVPKYGIVGAATATSLSFFVWVVITLVNAERMWPVRYPLGTFAVQLAAGFSGTAGLLLLHSRHAAWWQVALLAASCIAIIATVTIRRSELNAAAGMVRLRLAARAAR